MGVEPSDAGQAPEILSSAADNPRRTQKMKVTCVKLNASKVSIPTAKLVTEAASAANNQSSSIVVRCSRRSKEPTNGSHHQPDPCA